MWSENSIMIEALVYNALYLCGYLIPHSTFHTPHSTLHIYTMQKYTFFPKESRTLLVFLCKKGIIIIKTYKQLG